MKCTKDKCDKEAIYIVDGQSICKEHRDGKEEEGSISAGSKLVGEF